MTLSVARQCRLLRAPHGAVGALRRLQPAVTVAARSYTDEAKADAAEAAHAPERVYSNRRLDLTEYKQHQNEHDKRLRMEYFKQYKSEENTQYRNERKKRMKESSYLLTPKYEDSEIVSVNSAILVPASVATAKPEHFVKKIDPVHPLLLLKQNLVVFLVTPSFAPWLLDDRVFLEKALGKLYQNLPGPLPKVHAICAVVDKLPEAKPVGGDSGRDAVRSEFTFRAKHPPVNETGLEGIAYVVLPAKAEVSAQPNIGGELGCIDFLAHTHTTNQGRHNDRVRVPLANTIFQTGQSSTLINSTWERSVSDDRLELRTRRQIKTVVINLSAEDPKPGKSQPQSYLHQEAVALSIPLIPLTVPRRVDGHMGNIIRGVIGPDGNKITASTELEQAVPQYFKSRDEPAQATSAWALVIPKDKAHICIKDTSRLISGQLGTNPDSMTSGDHEYWEQKGRELLWQKDPPRWNNMIQEAIAKGARLHKVLSGGGGWGKKAGLLSLDPVPVGAPMPEQPAKESTAEHFDSVDEFSTALKPVVEDGDYIQFFISTATTQGEAVSAFEDLKKVEELTGGNAWSWEFGVIPSTIDSIPGGSWQHTGAASEEMVVFRGSFGALTEGGLTLMRGRGANLKTGVAGKAINTTTIDVPFSRWSAVRLRPKKGIETKRVGDFGKQAKANTGASSNPNIDADDALSPTVPTQHTNPTTSSPFSTKQRPQYRHTSTINPQGARAKSTFNNLKSLLVKRKLQQDSRQTDSKTRTSTPDSTPQARSYTSKPKCSSPIAESTSPGPEEPKRPLIRKTIPNEPDRPIISNNDTDTPDSRNPQKESPPGPKPKEDALKGQADHVKHPINLRHSSKLLSKLLRQQVESSQRYDEKEPQHQSKKAVKKVAKRVKKSTLTPKEKLQLIQDKKKEEEKILKERRKSFRGTKSERRKLQKLRKSQGFVVRRVGAGPPFNAGTEEAKVVHLTADDAGERARLSGKILARLTEQLRLVTGLKGSELEGLRRWRVRNERKRLVPTTALVGGRERGVVRTVEPKAQDIDKVGNVKSKLSPNTSYTLTPADLLATHMTNLHRRRASHRSPSGLDFVMRSIRLDPVSPQTQPHSPPLRNFQWFLRHLHGGLGLITKRTRILSAQLSSYLRDPTIRISRPAAGMPVRSRLSRRPTKSVHSSRLRHTLGMIHGRAKRIIKRIQILSAQVSAYHPHTPVPLAKHAARILPRSKLSRRPVQLTTPTNPTQHSDSTQHSAERLTARKVLLPARLRLIAARPPSEKLRYGDGRAFAGARWRTLRPSVSRKGFRNQREHVRSHLVGGRPEARKVTIQSWEERLEDDVVGWLGGGGM